MYDAQNPKQLTKAYISYFRSALKGQKRSIIKKGPSLTCSKTQTYQNISLAPSEQKQTIFATECTDRAAAVFLGYRKTKGLKRVIWKGEMKELRNALENYLGQCTQTGTLKGSANVTPQNVKGDEVQGGGDDEEESQDEEPEEDQVEDEASEPDEEEEIIF